ncbi:MAG: hypothetical protein GYA66_13475, partial [Phyllobacteriaceae bacterium]|nr:hypothetical protein [Phyllobacteriaceae bacterium]
MTAKSALLPLADKTSGRGRLSGFTSHIRLAMAIAVLLCVQFTGALQAQSETAAEADARLAGEVFSAIDAGKILARSVFDKDLSKQTDVFA